jgi:hypothetical protein
MYVLLQINKHTKGPHICEGFFTFYDTLTIALTHSLAIALTHSQMIVEQLIETLLECNQDDGVVFVDGCSLAKVRHVDFTDDGTVILSSHGTDTFTVSDLIREIEECIIWDVCINNDGCLLSVKSVVMTEDSVLLNVFESEDAKDAEDAAEEENNRSVSMSGALRDRHGF